MYWFTSDEHYGHKNVIEYCHRPYENITEMNETLIKNHNAVVRGRDIVVHGGDFAWLRSLALDILKRLNGTHIMLIGSHDRWMGKSPKSKGCIQFVGHRYEKMIGGQFVVIDHYAMRVWRRSHYNSWQLFGHSHGGLEPVGKQHDIGIDNNNMCPVSFEQLVSIMATRPDNFNYLGKERL